MGNLTKYECHNYIQYAVGVISVLIKAGRKTAEEQFGGSTDTHVLFLSLTLSQRVSHESDVSFRIESLAYIGITCNDLFTDVHQGFIALHLVKYPFYSFLYYETVTLRLVLAVISLIKVRELLLLTWFLVSYREWKFRIDRSRRPFCTQFLR